MWNEINHFLVHSNQEIWQQWNCAIFQLIVKDASEDFLFTELQNGATLYSNWNIKACNSFKGQLS